MREGTVWKRVARAGWIATCGIVLLAAAALLVLHTAPVRALLLRRIVQSVNEGIEGHLDASALEIHLPDFSVSGLSLAAPDGRVVATADRLEGVPLWPLVHHRLVLDGARLEGLRIRAAVDGDGVDLLRAAKRRPRPEQGGGGGLEIVNLSVSSGSIALAQRRGERGGRRLAAELSDGWVGRTAPGEPLRIALRGPRLAPVAGSYDASLAFHRAEHGQRVEVTLRSAALSAAFDVEPADGGRRIRVRDASVSPEAGRALWSAWPLREALRATGAIVLGATGSSADAVARIGAGELRIHGERGAGTGRAELTVRATGVDLAQVSPLPQRVVDGSARVVQLGARVEADVVVEPRGGGPGAALAGTARRLEGGGSSGVRVDALAGRIGEARWRLVRPAEVHWGDGTFSVDRFTVRVGPASITAGGRLHGDALDASVRVRGVAASALERLARWAGLASPRLVGTISADARVRGTAAKPLASLDVRAPRLTIAGGPPLSLRVGLGSGATSSRGTLDVATRWGHGSVRAAVPLDARALAEAWQRRGPGAIAFTASASATARAGALPWSAGRRVRGVASVEARAGGHLAAPWARAQVRLSGVTAYRAPPLDGSAELAWRRGEALSARGRFAARSGGFVEVEAQLGSALRAEVVASRFDPAPIAAFAPGILEAGGRIDGHASVAGPLDALRGAWALAWVDGTIRTRSYGAYGPFRVEARGDPSSAALAVDGGSGGGTFTLRVRASPVERGWRASGSLDAARLPLVVQSEMIGRVTTHIALSGDTTAGLLDAAARVENATVVLADRANGSVQALARPEGIVVASEGASDGEREPTGRGASSPEASAQQSASATPSWRLTVRTARPVAVHRHDLDLRVVTAPALRIEESDRMLVFGTLRASSGDVSLSGASVDAVSGTELRFAGPPEAPFVEIAAARDLEHGGMQVHGRRPGGSSSTRRHVQLYSLLAKGRVEPPRSSVHSSVEGRGWGSALERAFASQVPLGAFVERGTSSRSSDIRSSVTGQVDVGSVSRLAADPSQNENRRTIRLGIQLEPHVRLEGSSGDSGVSGIDVMWDLLGH